MTLVSSRRSKPTARPFGSATSVSDAQRCRPLVVGPPRRVGGRARRTRSRPSATPRELGADWVELDVRAAPPTARCVVHHDAQLPDGRAHRRARPRPSCPTSVPTLDEALDACAGMGVNVEIKNRPTTPTSTRRRLPSADAVVAELRRARRELDQLLVTLVRPRRRSTGCASSTPTIPTGAARRSIWPTRRRARCRAASPTGHVARSTRGTRSSTTRSSTPAHAAGLRGQRVDGRRSRPHAASSSASASTASSPTSPTSPAAVLAADVGAESAQAA